MISKLQNRGLSVPQAVLTAILCLFSAASVFYVAAIDGEMFDIFYCLATIPFVSLPLLLSLVFRWKLNNAFYVVFSFYALGPLLGAVYGLYYVTAWWDDLLHVLAGVIFAVCGACMADFINRKNKTSYLLSVLFGVCFSLAIAVLWELFEFSSDLIFGSDMQADSIVSTIATKMGRTDGGLTIFEHISDVSINGKSMGFGGYLDIGLIDTMRDMAVETAGAVVYLIYALIDRNRHPMIVPVENKHAHADTCDSQNA